MRKVLMFAVGLLVTLNCYFGYAQSAQATGQALSRTMMVRTAKEQGTIFSIDVDGREYWITAKHLFTGVKSGPAGSFTGPEVQVGILMPNEEEQRWLVQSFTTIDPGKDIDILVLVPHQALISEPSSLKTDSSVGFGGDCEFLGFPDLGGWKAHMADGTFFWFPYVKHCTVSGMLQEKPQVWILDGMNNFGFSGGPVLYGTGDQQKVFAVIAGYHTEPTEVLGEPPLPLPAPTGLKTDPLPKPTEKADGHGKQYVNLNSGFIVAFGIQPAIDAIRKNPIGPLRASK